MNVTGARDFEATHWSVVLAAAQANSTQAEAALEQLCRAYWLPLATFLQRQGYNPTDAEDLTQAFFASRFVTRLIFKGVSAEGGKFRSWLLHCFQNFVRNEWDRRNAKKRGGTMPHLSLEDMQEGSVASGSANLAETEFDRAFSLALLDRAITQLRIRYELAGKVEYFERLRVFLPGGFGRSYGEVASRLGKSQDAIEVAVSRLRRELGTLVRAEILRTVSSPAEAEEELRYFLSLWREPATPL